MATAIRNRSVVPLTLPFPMKGVLKAGQGIVLSATVQQVESALGPANPTLSITTVNQTSNFDDAQYLGQLLSPGIDASELEDDAVDTGALQDASVTGAKVAANTLTGDKLATGIDREEVVAGVDETGTPAIAVTGIAVGDELVSVLVNNSGVLSQRALADFTVAAGQLDVVGNAANNASNQYLIRWKDKT